MIRFTVDTNILFYSADRTDARKHRIATWCVSELERLSYPLPLQCLTELFCALTRKRVLSHRQAQELVERFAALLPTIPANASDLANAMALFAAGNIQFFDALVVSTTARAGCEVLLTEDMQHGRRIGAISLLNPFVMEPAELDRRLSRL